MGFEMVFGNHLRGGQAMITAKLPSLGNKPLKTIFAIRAINPPEQVVIDFIGNDRWYDRYIAAHEGGVQNGRKYLQFNESGTGTPGSLSTSGQCTPNWGNDGPGQPGGFGIFQLTRFGNPERLPNSQELWNWQQNVITAKQVILEKKAIADHWMQGQRAQAGNVLVPIHVVAGVTFADNSPKPIEDAVALKAYNGASGGHYCFWNNDTEPPDPHYWDFHPLNNLGENYVQKICQEVGQ